MQYLGWLLIALLFSTFMASGQDTHQELEAAKKKLEEMEAKIDLLRKAQNYTDAERLRRRAADLRESIARAENMLRQAAAENKQPVQKSAEVKELEKILEGLGHGLVALDKLGRREEYEMLMRVAEEVRAKLGTLKSEQQVKSVSRWAAQELEVLQSAKQALLGENRTDSAELIDLMIEAREIEHARRGDEASRKILEKAPNRAQQAELLNYAADIWRKLGQEKKALAISELAAKLLTGRPPQKKR